jgi:uncharacterized protein
MDSNIIYCNEFLCLSEYNNEIYLETLKKGFPFDKFHAIISSNPQIEITGFSILKASINNAPKPPELIGHLKEKIEIEITENDLKVIVAYNLSREELDIKNREKLIKETMKRLNEKGVVYGLNKTVFFAELMSGSHYVIAEGTPAVDGKDSIIKMYELQEAKPEIQGDGKVDFYELKLINRVKAGDWLGERTDATLGIPGQTVKGSPIKAADGKNAPLLYDKNTITEVSENGITTLYSRINGAVNFSDGKIIVSNHLDITGDIDFKTGNVNFDGYLSIKGTVADGFMVIASKDIEITGELGLGNVKGIISTGGSVFIKGGIASKGKVEIKAAKNIFTKFVDHASLICGETVHIGFYCINSSIEAKEVVIDSLNGQIMGGSIRAQIKVIAPIVGSEMEKRTTIEVTGFDRFALTEENDAIMQQMVALKNEQQKVKQTLAHLDGQGELNKFQRKEYNECFERVFNIKEEIRALESKRKNITGYLKAKGEGEICITKKVFPNTLLIIKKTPIEITTPAIASTYYVLDGELKQK